MKEEGRLHAKILISQQELEILKNKSIFLKGVKLEE